jgi:Flp pilus assembly protein TadD
VEPVPGDLVRLPLDPALEGALQSRLAAARLVREATSVPAAAESLLLEAVAADGAWSVPRYDLALLMIADGRSAEARGILAPAAGKPRAEMLLAFLDWAGEDLGSAIDHLECAAAGDPPAEALAAAATAYMAAGQYYLASRMWLRLLQDPGAPSALRLEAVRHCLMLSGRLELQETTR